MHVCCTYYGPSSANYRFRSATDSEKNNLYVHELTCDLTIQRSERLFSSNLVFMIHYPQMSVAILTTCFVTSVIKHWVVMTKNIFHARAFQLITLRSFGAVYGKKR